jgi:hypothetical protein
MGLCYQGIIHHVTGLRYFVSLIRSGVWVVYAGFISVHRDIPLQSSFLESDLLDPFSDPFYDGPTVVSYRLTEKRPRLR